MLIRCGFGPGSLSSPWSWRQENNLCLRSGEKFSLWKAAMDETDLKRLDGFSKAMPAIWQALGS